MVLSSPSSWEGEEGVVVAEEEEEDSVEVISVLNSPLKLAYRQL
jgi:hypothetical protein